MAGPPPPGSDDAPHSREGSPQQAQQDGNQYMYTVNDLVEQLGMTRHVQNCVLLAWACTYMSGVSHTLLVFLTDAVGEDATSADNATAVTNATDWSTRDTPLNTHAKSMLLLCTQIAGMVSTGIGGYTNDALGRARTITIFITLCAFAMVCLAYAQNTMELTVFSSLLIFAAACIHAGALLAEWLPMHWRGFFLVSLNILWNAGRLGITILWSFVPPTQQWTSFVIISSVPVAVAAAFLLARGHRYESPRYLALIGDHPRCVAVLRRAAEKGGVELPPGWDRPGALLLIEAGAGHTQSVRRRSLGERIGDICHPSYRVVMFALSLSRMFCGFSSAAIFFWGIEYYKRKGMEAAVKPAELAAPVGKIVSNLFLMAGGPGVCPIDSWRRVPILMMGFLGFAACTVGLCTVEATGFVTLVMFLAMFFEELIWSAGMVYSLEIFPTSVRPTAIGMTGVVGNLGNVVSTVAGGEFLDLHPELPFIISVGLLVLGFFLCWLLPPDNVDSPLADTAPSPRARASRGDEVQRLQMYQFGGSADSPPAGGSSGTGAEYTGSVV